MARSAGILAKLHRHRIFSQIDAAFLLELIGNVVHQYLVEVVAAEVRVAIRGQHLENAVIAHIEDRNIERTTTQVEHCYLLILLLVEGVGDAGRSRLVDNAHALLDDLAILAPYLVFGVETGDGRGIDGGLPLGIVEVGRNGNDRLADGVTEVSFRRFLELPQHHRGDFRRRERFAVDIHFYEFRRTTDDLVRDEFLFALDLVMPASHETLDRVDRALGIGNGLSFCLIANPRRSPLSVNATTLGVEAVTVLIRNDL